MKRDEKHETEDRYCLWTAPPASWQSPLADAAETVDISQMAEQLEAIRDATAEQDAEIIQPFRTPVCPQSLRAPVEG